MVLWADQLPIDVAADDAGAVLADVAALERIWERTRHGVDSAPGADAPLQQLRKVADAEDLSAVDGPAAALKQALAGLHAR
jgi:hypothetical protein